MHSDYNIEDISWIDFYKKCQKHGKIEFTIFFARIERKLTFKLFYFHVQAFYQQIDIFYPIKCFQTLHWAENSENISKTAPEKKVKNTFKWNIQFLGRFSDKSRFLTCYSRTHVLFITQVIFFIKSNAGIDYIRIKILQISWKLLEGKHVKNTRLSGTCRFWRFSTASRCLDRYGSSYTVFITQVIFFSQLNAIID